MKRLTLVVGLVILLAAVLAVGMIFAQGKVKSLSPTCSYTEQKDKDGQVVYALKGDGCKAIADKINQKSAAQDKAYGCKCVCTLSTGSNIWICRCCTQKQLENW